MPRGIAVLELLDRNDPLVQIRELAWTMLETHDPGEVLALSERILALARIISEANQ